MPATIYVSDAEAKLLVDNSVGGIKPGSNVFTYGVGDTVEILAKLPKDNDAYARLSSRLAGVAAQLGVPDVMFSKPTPAPAPEPTTTKSKKSDATVPPPAEASAEPAEPQAQEAGESEPQA